MTQDIGDRLRRYSGVCNYLHATSGGTLSFLPSKDLAPVIIDQPKSDRSRRPGHVNRLAQRARLSAKVSAMRKLMSAMFSDRVYSSVVFLEKPSVHPEFWKKALGV